MRQLAAALGKIPGIANLRPEAADISWAERARRLHDAGCDLGLELHTNWSISAKTGKPNTGVFVVIVAMHNPVHGKAEQQAMAERLFAPLAADMGMRLEIRTKDGTGGGHDWYGFLDACNRWRIPYPMIVEHGYHPDFARDVAETSPRQWRAGKKSRRAAEACRAARAACWFTPGSTPTGCRSRSVRARPGLRLSATRMSICAAAYTAPAARSTTISPTRWTAQTVAHKPRLEAGIIITAEEEL